MARTFLVRCTPPAPAALVACLERLSYRDGPSTEILLEAGLAELDSARSAPGRVRQSAFHLLAADALLTYACEAALEKDDPRDALVMILQQSAAPGR